MEIKVEEISRIIRQQIEDYDRKVEVGETGTVPPPATVLPVCMDLERHGWRTRRFTGGVQGGSEPRI